MRALCFAATVSVALLAMALLGATAYAETDRSAAIRQVTRGETLAERSAADFDQIATVETGRSKVDQIDPSMALKIVPESNRLEPEDPEITTGSCTLTREQQAIVTSLQSQGKLPAGDCELTAWFAQPGDKSEGEERRALAESVAATAPDLLGREGDTERAASMAAQQQQAEAAGAIVSTTIFTPVTPAPPGK